MAIKQVKVSVELAEEVKRKGYSISCFLQERIDKITDEVLLEFLHSDRKRYGERKRSVYVNVPDYLVGKIILSELCEFFMHKELNTVRKVEVLEKHNEEKTENTGNIKKDKGVSEEKVQENVKVNIENPERESGESKKSVLGFELELE